MAYTVDFKPAWLDWIAPEVFNDLDLFRIVVFFVFHSPCQQLSAMGRSLEEYGWTHPWKKPYWLSKQLKSASSNQNLLFSSASYDLVEDALRKADLLDSFPQDYNRERICIYDNKKNQFISVFYHIRNAFAHGRLNMVDCNGECVFILEDIASTRVGFKVSSRMIIKKSTLLSWIDIIEGGEKAYQPDESKL